MTVSSGLLVNVGAVGVATRPCHHSRLYPDRAPLGKPSPEEARRLLSSPRVVRETLTTVLPSFVLMLVVTLDSSPRGR